MSAQINELDDFQPDDIFCLYCKSGILTGGTKCPSCGSFQNWRRHLGLWATLISLFLGAVATYGLMREPINYVFKKEYSIRTEQVSVTSKSYTVEIKNTGRKPFSINSAAANINIENQNSDKFFYALEWDVENETLAPGDVTFLKLTIPESQRQKYLKDSNNVFEAQCGVTIKTSADDNIITGGQYFDETEISDDGSKSCGHTFQRFLSGVDIANIFKQDIFEKMNNGVGRKLKEAFEKLEEE